MIDYLAGYNFILELQGELLNLVKMELSHIPRYKSIQALAATYELQDYLAGQLAAESEE